ncbi:MAG: AAA family ATPase, partial [Proteobacteria bacterium]|nr:AAA family ATPase [Pseudomonadota bacterium]
FRDLFMQFQRVIDLSRLQKSSTFLFGPRMTGKTSILKAIDQAVYINLLDVKLQLDYRTNPSAFWEQLNAIPKSSLVIIDEIQKIPELLDVVQMAIDDLDHRFILSGSSARKLRRSGANLLGGRAIEELLFTLSSEEIDNRISLERVLQFGSLPRICSLVMANAYDEARDILYAYSSLYIRDEIQAEALTRNIASFTRFIQIAAQSHGHVIEYSNISESSKVPATTVKEYFSILEDTLIGCFLWPWDRSERRKARPKFYLFDPGVVRAMQNRLNDPPTGQELGFLFEGWFIYEVKKINHYFRKRLSLDLWRDGDLEVDLLVRDSSGRGFAFEIKSGLVKDVSPTVRSKLKRDFPDLALSIVSLTDRVERKLDSGLMVYPWQVALSLVRNM